MVGIKIIIIIIDRFDTGIPDDVVKRSVTSGK